MDTLSLTVRYRPIRVGWCVRAGDWESLRKVLRVNFCLWGGRFNPIIPFQHEKLSRALVSLFRVDVLLPGAPEDADTKAFIAKFRHLPNPFHRRGMFVEQLRGGKGPVLVDILHPMQRMFDEHIKNVAEPKVAVSVRTWQVDDPLSDVLLSTFGSLPDPAETGNDYLSFLKNELRGTETPIAKDAAIPPLPPAGHHGLSFFSRAFLSRHYNGGSHRSSPGFYVGDASDFDDLVNFWNLSATDTRLLFVDPAHEARFAPLRDGWLSVLSQRPPSRFKLDNAISVWAKEGTTFDGPKFGADRLHHRLDEANWNGMNIRAPCMYFSEGRTLASVGADSGSKPRVAFQLPRKPVDEDAEIHEQHFVIGINPGIGLFRNERATLHTPYVPELNEYYGRECHFDWNKARVEPDGLGIIASVDQDHVSLKSLSVNALFTRLFAEFGIAAEPSKPGLVTTRLIEQMGGIQSCRVFQVTGVRSLIEQHGPTKSFTRGLATKTIWGAATPSPLTKFENLYIEARPHSTKLNSDMVFSYLLRKQIFRAGLRLECPSCSLEFWVSLDDSRTHTTCEYCGQTFNVTPMLKDRDWAYRRSGLFGRDDHQEGAIPVVLTLQQLDTVFSSRDFLYTTAMTLRPSKGEAKIDPCETDFIAMVPQPRDNRIDIAIGECKTRKPIDEADVTHMKAVAAAFPTDRFDVYIIFSKLAPFTPEEIEHVRKLNDDYQRRVILFTPAELESWRVYAEVEEKDKHVAVVSFGDMAEVTHNLYLNKS